jgi:hypothetical protein
MGNYALKIDEVVLREFISAARERAPAFIHHAFDADKKRVSRERRRGGVGGKPERPDHRPIGSICQ